MIKDSVNIWNYFEKKYSTKLNSKKQKELFCKINNLNYSDIESNKFSLKDVKKLKLTFRQKVYSALIGVPKGSVITYKCLANKINSKAYRAVGTAMNKNPYAPDIPCHRVISENRGLGGFAGGIKNKIKILKSEGVIVKNNKIDEKYVVN